MSKITRGLVLASASPRRLDLLRSISIIPEIIKPSDIEETIEKKEDPLKYCSRMAKMKGNFIFEKYPEMTILSADTIVLCGRKVFGKPRNEAEARNFLNIFSGRKHTVVTAIFLKNKKTSNLKKVVSKVTFKRLEKKDIDLYLPTKEWENKAGGYAIQGYAERFIKTLNGSYSNVVGLPLYQAFNLLKSANII